MAWAGSLKGLVARYFEARGICRLHYEPSTCSRTIDFKANGTSSSGSAYDYRQYFTRVRTNQFVLLCRNLPKSRGGSISSHVEDTRCKERGPIPPHWLKRCDGNLYIVGRRLEVFLRAFQWISWTRWHRKPPASHVVGGLLAFRMINRGR